MTGCLRANYGLECKHRPLIPDDGSEYRQEKPKVDALFRLSRLQELGTPLWQCGSTGKQRPDPEVLYAVPYLQHRRVDGPGLLRNL